MSGHEKKYILSIDLGTSGCKSAIVSTTTDVIGWEYEEVPVYFFPNGGAENNPKDYWNGFYRTTKRLMEKELVPASGLRGAKGAATRACCPQSTDAQMQTARNACARREAFRIGSAPLLKTFYPV